MGEYTPVLKDMARALDRIAKVLEDMQSSRTIERVLSMAQKQK